MKNLFITAFVAFGLMSFTTPDLATVVAEHNDSCIFMETSSEEDFPCRIRACVIIDGIKHCGPWIEGECTIVNQ
jgi:hypothetical protein